MARPSDLEQRRRQREFLRLIGQSRSFERAVDESGLSVRQALRLLDDPAGRKAVAALLDGEAA